LPHDRSRRFCFLFSDPLIFIPIWLVLPLLLLPRPQPQRALHSYHVSPHPPLPPPRPPPLLIDLALQARQRPRCSVPVQASPEHRSRGRSSFHPSSQTLTRSGSDPTGSLSRSIVYNRAAGLVCTSKNYSSTRNLGKHGVAVLLRMIIPRNSWPAWDSSAPGSFCRSRDDI
jgi:hypothetical protein